MVHVKTCNEVCDTQQVLSKYLIPSVCSVFSYNSALFLRKKTLRVGKAFLVTEIIVLVLLG